VNEIYILSLNYQGWIEMGNFQKNTTRKIINSD